MLNKRKQREQERQRQLNNDYSNPNDFKEKNYKRTYCPFWNRCK